MASVFDIESEESVVLYNERGEAIAFERIAIIPLGTQAYVILKPVRPMEGVGEEEGLVFSVTDDGMGGEQLSLVCDERVIDEVFTVYDRLVAEQGEGL